MWLVDLYITDHTKRPTTVDKMPSLLTFGDSLLFCQTYTMSKYECRTPKEIWGFSESKAYLKDAASIVNR